VPVPSHPTLPNPVILLLGAARRCPPPAAQRRAPRGAVVPPAVPSHPFLPVPGVLLLGVERRCPPPLLLPGVALPVAGWCLSRCPSLPPVFLSDVQVPVTPPVSYPASP